MTGNTSCKIGIFCEVNPSEEKAKIESAILNIFSDLQISIGEHQIKGKSNNINTLSKVSQSIHKKNTKNVYQRILQKNTNENSTWFYLNKQAAFTNIITLCDEEDQSPLGPIKVVLHSKNIEDVIDWLVSDVE